MADNKKKKKLDAKRVAFKQEYEVDYLKKSAQKLIDLFENDIKQSKKEGFSSTITLIAHDDVTKDVSAKTIVRILKGLLKLLEK